jgi:hypothetical protein
MHSSGTVRKGDGLCVSNIPEVFRNGRFVLFKIVKWKGKETTALHFNIKTSTSNAALNNNQHGFGATE